MGFIKSFIETVRGTPPVSTNRSKAVVEEAPLPLQGQQHASIQAPQPPVQLPVDQMPQTLADAIAYVRMGEPKSNYADVVTWHITCGEIRNQYKTHALNELRSVLQVINSDSLTETENAIDSALLKLQTLAPVDWVLDRRHMKDHADGSRSYRLIRHYAKINPNGAFAITDLKHETWLAQGSANGIAFVNPHE